MGSVHLISMCVAGSVVVFGVAAAAQTPDVAAGSEAPEAPEGSEDPREGADAEVLEGVARARCDLGRRLYDQMGDFACPRCSERLRIKGSIAARADIDRVLEALGIPTDPPAIASARAPTQQALHL